MREDGNGQDHDDLIRGSGPASHHDAINHGKGRVWPNNGSRGGGRDETLHVGRPNIGDRRRLLERINAILDNRWLTNGGPFVREFEQRIAEVAGTKHCIAMCNGTIALEIAIRALGLTGEVILPSFTFVATAHALQWQGLRPVFCDVDPKTYTIDPRRIEPLITSRTSGILGVHTWGRPCNVDALSEIARRNGLRLLFDAAHAFGCTYKGCTVGRFGDAEVFSFHATKYLNAFEGGAVVTNSDALTRKMRLMKNFGFVDIDQVADIGTNGKMTEIAAAMGLTSLESMDAFIAVNRRNYETYRRALEGVRGLRLIEYDEQERGNYHYVVLEVDEAVTGISRDALIDALVAEKVLARRYFYPGCHRMEPYRSLYPEAGSVLPQTEALAARVIALPTGTAVSEEAICRVCGILKAAIYRSISV